MQTTPLIIIPARRGSVGISLKNFLPLAGISPLRRAFETVWQAGFGNIVISTDHPMLKGYPFVRYVTAPLHTNICSAVDVVLDVLQAYPGPDDQRVLYVQPTQPLRTAQHLQMVLHALETHPSCATVVETTGIHKLYYRSASGGFEPVSPLLENERRQHGRQTFKADGTCYGFRREWFMQHQSFRSPETQMLVIPADETCSLDTADEWRLATGLLRYRARTARISRALPDSYSTYST